MLHFLQRGMFSQPLPSVMFAFLKYLYQQLGIPVVVVHHLVFQYRKNKKNISWWLKRPWKWSTFEVNERDLSAWQFCRFVWFVFNPQKLFVLKCMSKGGPDERFAPNSGKRLVKKKWLISSLSQQRWFPLPTQLHRMRTCPKNELHYCSYPSFSS